MLQEDTVYWLYGLDTQHIYIDGIDHNEVGQVARQAVFSGCVVMINQNTITFGKVEVIQGGKLRMMTVIRVADVIKSFLSSKISVVRDEQ